MTFYEKLKEKQKILDEECKKAFDDQIKATEYWEKCKEDALFIDEAVAYIECYRNRKKFVVSYCANSVTNRTVYYRDEVYANNGKQAFDCVIKKLKNEYVNSIYDAETDTLNCGIVVFDSFVAREVN